MKPTIRVLLLILIIAPTAWAGEGNDVGGTKNGSIINPEWCRSQSGILDLYQDAAESTLEDTGSRFAANQYLIKGMNEALKADANVAEKTFTHKSLERGLEIALLLDAQDSSKSDRHAEVVYYILTSFYDFVIQDVAQNLDLPAYIPYMNSQYGGDPFDVREFEHRFIEYAAKQINWLNTALIIHDSKPPTDNLPAVHTKGNSAYLKAAEVIAKYALQDLQTSLWENRFACAIQKLQAGYDFVSAYNLGNHAQPGFKNDVQAIKSTYKFLNEVQSKLGQADSCN